MSNSMHRVLARFVAYLDFLVSSIMLVGVLGFFLTKLGEIGKSTSASEFNTLPQFLKCFVQVDWMTPDYVWAVVLVGLVLIIGECAQLYAAMYLAKATDMDCDPKTVPRRTLQWICIHAAILVIHLIYFICIFNWIMACIVLIYHGVLLALGCLYFWDIRGVSKVNRISVSLDDDNVEEMTML